ncbi:uncharacterized protein [Watersipora subatra]|uniref:uncharacterized protein n=1 Tax=Watersipora subatra TaxID=2589382 RepID=UPI00355BCDDF
MASTAFTVDAWQGLITNSIITGLGAAFLAAATYSTLSRYFPGNQLAPYAAITVCQNIGVMATPQVIAICMEQLKFQSTFLICSSVMTINILCGLTFLPKENVTELATHRKNSVNSSTISLKFNGKATLNMGGNAAISLRVYARE